MTSKLKRTDFLFLFWLWSPSFFQILEYQTEVQEVLINKEEEETRKDNLFSRIMFLPAIEQYKLSVISYFHVETAKTRKPKKKFLLLTKNDTDRINYLEKNARKSSKNYHLEEKYLRFSEENGDDGRFYNRSNLQVSPKNDQNPFLFFFWNINISFSVKLGEKFWLNVDCPLLGGSIPLSSLKRWNSQKIRKITITALHPTIV